MYILSLSLSHTHTNTHTHTHIHTHSQADLSFTIFSMILMDFIGCCFQMNLTTSPAITLLHSMAKVVCVAYFVSMCATAKMVLLFDSCTCHHMVRY